MSKYGILIHGGAGDLASDGCVRLAMRDVVASSYKMLEQDGTSVDVSQYAVSIMEDSGIFNAGIGSCLTRDRTMEMDAGMMDGKTMQCGAVGAVRNIKNPVNLARHVMYGSDHSLITGSGALEFALSCGFEKYDMIPTDEQLKKLEVIHVSKYGTVGAVVLDSRGDLASAVSTGGMWNKAPGRIGDSPIVGSGYYARNGVGAAVATGNGDVLMKSCVSRRACDLMGQNTSAQDAADAVISELGLEDGGNGGMIVTSGKGDVGISFNTKFMSSAYMFDGMPEIKASV